MPSIPERDDEDDDPAVAVAIERMSVDGRDHRDIAHALIAAGLCHLRANFCDAHVIEELEFVRGWIDERLSETRAAGMS